MAGNGNAHSAIDNLLVANTLQEILRNPRGGSFEDLLYEIQTKGGDKRYIHGYKNAALLVRDFLVDNSLQEFGYDI